MWLLFGNRTKVRPVEGGRFEERLCPSCKTVRQFVECDVADQVHLFFVPILNGTTRRMVCTTCGEDLEVPTSRTPSPAPQENPRSAQAPAQRPSDKDLEKQLAALKKRMSR